ncbi:MAG: hypothetical protein KKH40_08390, partial [Nanoarchaeota archaeon]|nr:hypothetical protein [Nanoarchaeota archaeon]
HEKVKEEKTVKHSFILFFTKVKVEEENFKETKAGKLQWFNIEEIEEDKVIPSDMWLIKNKLNSKINVISAEIRDEKGKLSIIF